MSDTPTVLKLSDLRTYFHTDVGVVKAVDGLNVSVKAGQTLGIVGESGSGKSVTSLSIMQLLPGVVSKIEEGSSIVFMDRELTEITEPEMRAIRGKEISMIFQEPMTSLNPVYTTGEQVVEALLLHQAMTREEAVGSIFTNIDSTIVVR